MFILRNLSKLELRSLHPQEDRFHRTVLTSDKIAQLLFHVFIKLLYLFFDDSRGVLNGLETDLLKKRKEQKLPKYWEESFLIL